METMVIPVVKPRLYWGMHCYLCCWHFLANPCSSWKWKKEVWYVRCLHCSQTRSLRGCKILYFQKQAHQHFRVCVFLFCLVLQMQQPTPFFVRTLRPPCLSTGVALLLINQKWIRIIRKITLLTDFLWTSCHLDVCVWGNNLSCLLYVLYPESKVKLIFVQL